MQQQSVSLNQKAWRRLKKNKVAMAGLSFILFTIFIAVFAPLIAPDSSPDANQQILQLETHSPGFSIYVLHIQKNIPDDKKGFSTLLDGIVMSKKNPYQLVPVLDWSFEGAYLHYTAYKGKQFSAVKDSILMADVVYRLAETPVNGLFTDIDGNNQQIVLEDLAKIIEQNHLKKRTYWLGTDNYGRDILSRLIVGSRISLSVGIIAVGISLFIGILLGSLAGYFRGKVDDFIMWFINVFWSVPTLLLAMGLYVSLGSLLENDFWLIYVAVGLTMWVSMARIVRGQFLSIRESEFVEASRSLGFSHARTIFIHILPNLLGPIIVIAAANFANAILIEAGLSFIGFGVKPPTPSWGSMLNTFKDYIDTDKAYLAIFPGAAIMILVLSFNLLGNGLRDALDVRSS